MEAVAQEHLTVVWLLLLFASAGVFHHAGIKIPYFAFFAHDRGHRVAEAPLNMRVAMTMAAMVCIGIGVAPGVIYGILPYAVDYAPYTTPHVINQLQLLLLAAMAFTMLIRTGLYPPEVPSVNLDADVVYRRIMPSTWNALSQNVFQLRDVLRPPLLRTAKRPWDAAVGPLLPDGSLATPWSTTRMVWWVAVLLGATLLLTLL
jgi:multicomponent Na+:H+ antiporter subunit D